MQMLLDLSIHRYRVVIGDRLVGHFSTFQGAAEEVHGQYKATVIDNLSGEILYERGCWR